MNVDKRNVIPIKKMSRFVKIGFNLSKLVGVPPPHPRNVDLKVSEMSAFRPPRVAPQDRWG